MQSNRRSIVTIVAIGIGAAVFIILGRFVSIPTGIPNTTIETSYAFLALMSIVYGPVAGALIGLIGHALKDARWINCFLLLCWKIALFGSRFMLKLTYVCAVSPRRCIGHTGMYFSPAGAKTPFKEGYRFTQVFSRSRLCRNKRRTSLQRIFSGWASALRCRGALRF